MTSPDSQSKWLWKFQGADQKLKKFNYGAYNQTNLPRLSLEEIASLSLASGIHPDVLGPCRRAAAELNWYLLFRLVNRDSMHHYGDFDKVPKPPGLYSKVDKQKGTGMVRFDSQEAFQADVSSGTIDSGLAERQGLHLDDEGILRNSQGQGFYSDMDLYDVFNGTNGRQVRLGSGVSADQGIKNRRALDKLINILRPLGTSFALIQHGPDRQWVNHTPTDEEVITFCPDGRVFILKDLADFNEFRQREFQ